MGLERPFDKVEVRQVSKCMEGDKVSMAFFSNMLGSAQRRHHVGLT